MFVTQSAVWPIAIRRPRLRASAPTDLRVLRPSQELSGAAGSSPAARSDALETCVEQLKMSPSGPNPTPHAPNSTNAFVTLLEAWAGYDPAPGLITALRKTPLDVLRGKITVEGVERDLLELLNGQRHGPGLLLVLVDRLKTGQPDLGALLTAVIRFSETVIAPTLCALPDYVFALSELLPDLATHLGSLSLCLPPLYNIAIRYMPFYVLTPVDAELVRQSLRAREYSYALPILQRDKCDVDMRAAPIHSHDNLTYHFAGGIIHGLQNDWERAAHFFEIVVGAPGPVASHVQVEAYKKLLLSQLLTHGKTLPLPRYVSSHVRSAFKNFSNGPYGEFAAAFEGATRRNEKGRKLVALAEKHRETFEKDRNWGLVQLCLRDLSARSIMALTRTYSTVPLSLIALELDLAAPASETSLSVAASTVMDLVASRKLFATIDPPQEGSSMGPTVKFLEDPETYDGEEMVRKLDGLTYNLKAWTGYASKLEMDVEANREFLTKALKDGKGIDPSGGGGPGVGWGMTGAGAMYAEDLEMGNPGWEDEYGA